MQMGNRIDWARLLAEAITEPGKISDAYRRFHGYSPSNRLWAMSQCTARGITPGPLATSRCKIGHRELPIPLGV